MPIPITSASIIVAILFGAISAYLAHQREKNPYKWFFIGFLFGIFGLFALFFSLSKKAAPVLLQKIEPPLPVIRGPADKFWYYLDPYHVQQGPMSHSALITSFKEGKIFLSTYVWNEEMTEWKILQDLTSSP